VLGRLYTPGVPGHPSNGGLYIAFDSPQALLAYLPAPGAAGQLNASALDPTSTSAGSFGGDVLALRLDVDFSDAGRLPTSSSLKFGDLTVCGLTDTPTSTSEFNGMSVREVLAALSAVLGGQATTDTDDTLDAVAYYLSGSFEGGTPSTWAQQHLENGACGWHQGDLTTYGQLGWTSTSPAQLVTDHFYTLYPGDLEVGGTYYLAFDSPEALLDYLPAVEPRLVG